LHKTKTCQPSVARSFEDKAVSGVCSLTALLGDRTRAIARQSLSLDQLRD
jgi:hypothetical protein